MGVAAGLVAGEEGRARESWQSAARDANACVGGWVALSATCSGACDAGFGGEAWRRYIPGMPEGPRQLRRTNEDVLRA